MQQMTDKKYDQERVRGNTSETELKGIKRGEHTNEDQFFKKQMEFKGGKRH